MLREPEDPRSGPDVARGPECGVRNGQHSRPVAHVDLDLAVHARHEQSLGVLDTHQHGEHRDVLLRHRLRLDLEHAPLEGSIGVGGHRHGRREIRVDLSDVCFVHEGPDPHMVEVGHLQEHRPIADVPSGRRDDLPALHILLDDRAADRRPDLRVVHLDSGALDRDPRADHFRLRVGMIE